MFSLLAAAVAAPTTVDYLTPGAVVALAGTIAGLGKWTFQKVEKLQEEWRAQSKADSDARLADQKAETIHREALLEKVLTVVQEHNEGQGHMLALVTQVLDLIKEVRDNGYETEES